MPANRAYQLDAGGSITLFYKTENSGVTPPEVPNVLELRVYHETGTGLLIRTLHNAAPPADGTSFTFWGTHDGTETGLPRCGTVRLYIRAAKTDGAGGVGNYDVTSDANGDMGGLQVRMANPSHAVSAYPAGATFAYGTAGNETITVTVTHTQKYADRDIETVRIDALDLTAQQAAGTQQDQGATTTTTQAFTANNTFDDAAKSYGSRYVIVGNSALLTARNWTSIGTGSATQHDRLSYYNVDPRITMGVPTLGQTIYNRNEAATIDVGITNARGESLTRNVAFQIKDSGGAVVSSPTVSAIGDNIYDIDITIPNTAKATWDLVGDQWTFNTNQSDVTTNPSANIYKVSRKWQFSTLGDGTINGEIFTGKALGSTSDVTKVRNRGQVMYFRGYVYNARGQLLLSGSAGISSRWSHDETQFGGAINIALTTPFDHGPNIGTSDSPGPWAVLIQSGAWNSTASPRTGTAGNGNFAETTIAEPTTPDSSSFNRTLTVKGRTDMYGPPLRVGSGKSFDFEGVDRGVNTSAVDCGAFSVAGNMCVECRFRPDTVTPSFQSLVPHNTGGTNATMNFYLGLNGNKLVGIVADGPSGSDRRIIGTTVLAVNTSYAAAIDYDGTTLRLWLKKGSADATLEGTLAVSQVVDNVPTAKVYIGRRDNAVPEMFNGLIDEVRISNISRYASAFNPPDAPFNSDANTLLLAHLDTISGGAEWNLSAWYDLEVRTQKEALLNADAEDTQFTIGEDVLYAYADELNDQSGDPIPSVSLQFRQFDPTDTLSSSVVNQTTDANGEATAARFDAKAPKGAGWKVEAKNDTAHNGNLALGEQLVSMVSAFTADKNQKIVAVSMVNPARHILAHEKFFIVNKFAIKGVFSPPDASPLAGFAIGRVVSKTETIWLQSDGTFIADDTPNYFNAVHRAETGLISVSVGPGEDIDVPLTNFIAGKYLVNTVLYLATQEFRDDEDFEIVEKFNPHHKNEFDGVAFATGMPFK